MTGAAPRVASRARSCFAGAVGGTGALAIVGRMVGRVVPATTSAACAKALARFDCPAFALVGLRARRVFSRTSFLLFCGDLSSMGIANGAAHRRSTVWTH